MPWAIIFMAAPSMAGKWKSLQKISTYSAAVRSNAASAGPAGEFIDFLVSPASQAVFKAKGMDAVVP